jgi:IS30 family transposase
MGTILHGGAKTTPRIRKEIQESKKSLTKLAKIYNLNIKTIAKWKKRSFTEDKRSGKIANNTILSKREEKIICESRRNLKLPLDDLYVALKDEIKTLSRSNLHRCLRRNGLSVLPKEIDPQKNKKKFVEYKIGYVHIDITSVKTKEGSCYIFVAVERKTKSVFLKLFKKMTTDNAVEFVKKLIDYFPFKIHRILTDNGAQFTFKGLLPKLQPKNKIHPFVKICQENKIHE